MRKFDLEAERKYYHEDPSGVSLTNDTVVHNMMQGSTNLPDWHTLLDNAVVLEVGAGECSYLHSFLKRATPKIYLALDIFPARMRYAKEFYQNVPVSFIGANVLKMPIRNDSIDLCMAFGLLHHIPNLEEAVAEIARVLKPGGRFIFRDPWAGNPAIWLKYRVGHRSENEFPLTKRKLLRIFRKVGLQELNIARFWLRFPWLPPGPWSVNIGGLAEKSASPR